MHGALVVDERYNVVLTIEEWVVALLAALLLFILRMVSFEVLGDVPTGTTLYRLLGSSGGGGYGRLIILSRILNCVGLW